MNKEIVVKPIERNQLQRKKYNAFIATVGYEQRAYFIAQSGYIQADKLIACAFDARKIYNYQFNWEWFHQAGFSLAERPDSQFQDWWSEELKEICSVEEENIRICVDISSMSRLRIAAIIAAVLELRNQSNIEIDFLYAPAKFSKPIKNDTPIIISEPVIDKFAGWSDEPERACVVVLGLGYEADKAVGAIEYIEPAEVWAFCPSGEDNRYDKEVESANEALWDVVPRNHVFKYEVAQPFQCLADLESLVYGTLRSNRPVLVPFGPKIFTLCCLIVASIHYPKVVVWRVSSGQFEPAVDRVSNGKITGLNVMFKQGLEEGRLLT